MDIIKAIKADVRANNEQARKAIEGKSVEEIKVFARQFLLETFEFPKAAFLKTTFRDYIEQRFPAEHSIQIAEEDGHAYEALREVVSFLRRKQKNVPPQIRDYVLDVELKVRRRPRKRGSRTSFRNHQICHCIELIVEYSQLRASRNEENDTPCAISLVAEVKGLSYDQVKDIWENRERY